MYRLNLYDPECRLDALLFLFVFNIALFELLIHKRCVLPVNKVMHQTGEEVDEYYCYECEKYGHRCYPAPAEHLYKQQRYEVDKDKVYPPQQYRLLDALLVKAQQNS